MKRFTGHTEPWGVFLDVKNWKPIANPHKYDGERIVIGILIFVLYEIVIWMKKSDNNQAIIYSNIHFCGVIVSLLATSLPMMIRIFMSFRYLEFLSVPYLIEIQPKRKYKQLIELAVILLYLVYFIHGVLIENGNTVLPYRTIFNKGW